MAKYEESPEAAEVAIKEASDKASHLDYVVALAHENLEFAEQTLVYARESGNTAEIADAERERDELRQDYAALQEDRDKAIQEVFTVQAYWGFN